MHSMSELNILTFEKRRIFSEISNDEIVFVFQIPILSILTRVL